MSGRGGRGGRGRGGRGAPLSQSRLLLQRSAMEAGIDEQHAVLDLTRPRLYADFLWHSSGDPKNLEPGDDNETTKSSNSNSNSTVTMKRSAAAAATRTMVNKQREFLERFASSPYFVKIHQTVDVERYNNNNHNDRSKQQNNNNHHHNNSNYRNTYWALPDEILFESMGQKLAHDERYIPSDLAPEKSRMAAAAAKSRDLKSTLRTNKRKATTPLDDLEQRERTGGAGGGTDPNRASSDNEEEEEENPDADDPIDDDDDDYMQDHYASNDDDSGDGGGEAYYD